MSALNLAVGEDLASVADGDKVIVYLILLTSLVALGFAALFAKEVLAAGQGTPKMIEISKAVQEGAAAYLNRQFKTLAVFAGLVFLLLFLLPADETSVKVGRPIFFLVGAAFSALVGLHRHDAGDPHQPARRERRQRVGHQEGAAPGVPRRWRRRHVHRRPRPARRDDRAAHLRRGRAARARGLRLRWRPARDVHACRRRHLHQGR